MADIDTSIYNSPPQPNFLMGLKDAANVANLVNQNRLFQQEFGAKQAVGQDYQQAIDPSTGQLNVNRLLGLVAHDPRASWMAGDVAQSAAGLRQTNVQTQGAELDQSFKRTNNFFNSLGPLLATGKPVSYGDIVGAAAEKLRLGQLTPSDFVAITHSIPTDPAKATEYVKSRYGQVFSPEAATTPTVTGMDSYGRPVRGTRLQFLGATAQSAPETGTSSSTLGQGAPATAGGALGRAASKPPGVVTDLAPGEADAMKNSAASWQALRNDVGAPNGSAARLFQLNKALTALQNTNTGPGTEGRNAAVSFLNALPGGVGKYIPGVDPESIKNYDEANKYLTQYASQAAGSFGPATDAKLATALSGNANTHISNLAAQDVVKANIALERMKQAQASAFQSSGMKPGQFSDWSVNWNKSVDPRAFELDFMSPAARVSLFHSLKGGDLKKFRDSVRLAISSGVLDPSALSAPEGNNAPRSP